jgi:hypothetical protein
VTFDGAWQGFIDWTPLMVAEMNAVYAELMALALAASGPGTFTNIAVTGNATIGGDAAISGDAFVVGKLREKTGKAGARLRSGPLRTAACITSPNGGTAALVDQGIALNQVAGTLGNHRWATPLAGNIQRKYRHLTVTQSTPATNAIAYLYSNAGQVTFGDPTLGGGFDLNFRVGISEGAAAATLRARFGMSTGFTNTDVEPSSVNNSFCFGWDAADTNCQVIYRSTGSATKIDLGASFPVPTANFNNMYDVRFFSPNDEAAKVYYEVVNLLTGAVATGSFTHPSGAGQVLSLHFVVSAGGTSSAVGFAFGGVTLEFND